jgi:hypothetical protein
LNFRWKENVVLLHKPSLIELKKKFLTNLDQRECSYVNCTHSQETLSVQLRDHTKLFCYCSSSSYWNSRALLAAKK